GSSRNLYSPGSGECPASTIALSLPRDVSARCIASNDPSASPSGFSCEVTVKRSWPRRAASTCSISIAALILRVVARFGGELVDQLVHAHPPLDRVIVRERELRSPAEMKLARDAALQDASRPRERGERALLVTRRPEHAHPDGCMCEVARGLDARHGDEPETRILELLDRLRQHLLDRLVDAAHPAAAAALRLSSNHRGSPPCA